jgi:hypothetical protein
VAELQDAIDQVIAVLRDVSGIRKVPSDPPEQLTAWPAAVVYVQSGAWKMGAGYGGKTGLHNIVIELHFDREVDLAHTVEEALKFADRVPNDLLSAFLDNLLPAVQTFEDIVFEFGPLGWGGKSTLGYRWTIRNIKMQSTIT